MMQSNLSFEEYAAWCRSRVPPFDPGHGPESTANTVLAANDDECPVTIRSRGDQAVVTPRPKGSQ